MAGEIWLADRGDERRHRVFVLSDERFHRLGQRAVIAPVVAGAPPLARPWHVPVGESHVAVNHLGTMAIEKLLEPVERPPYDVLRRVRRVARQLTG